MINGRTLSGVTRRAGVPSGPDVDRRVTFDRAVWTKPLVFAADAARRLWALNRGDPWRSSVARHDGALIAAVAMP